MKSYVKAVIVILIVIFVFAAVFLVGKKKNNKNILLEGKGLELTSSEFSLILADVGIDSETASNAVKLRLINDWMFKELLYKEVKN